MPGRRSAKRFLEWCLCSACYYSGLNRLAGPLHRRVGTAASIILYHRVYPDGHGPRGRLERSAFRAQLQHLMRWYTVMHLEELVDLVTTGRPLPPRAVAVTIDDGYCDTYTEAFPAIQEARCPVTVFLSAGSIGTRQIFWWDQLFYAIRHTPKRPEEVDRVARAHGLPAPDWRGPDIEEMLIAIKQRPEGEMQRMVNDIVDALGVDAAANRDDFMMSWDEARAMADSGLVTMSAHAVTHRNLAKIGLDDVRKEVADSKTIIEQQLDRPVSLFAYPFGKRASDYTDEVKTIVRLAGFAGALTVDAVMAEQGVDPFEIPRVCESSEQWRGPDGRFSPALFDAYLTGVREYMSFLSPRHLLGRTT